MRNANVWVHRNECHSREPLADQPQYPVSAPVGIAVYPGGDFPRLPIFGLQAIADNELVLKVCGWRRMATLRTVRKWWPFG